MIESFETNKNLTEPQALSLRRWLAGDGVIDRKEANALLRLNAGQKVGNATFSALYVELLTDFLVYQQRPTGKVTGEQANWLIDEMGGGKRLLNVNEMKLLATILEEASEIHPRLKIFAAEQTRRLNEQADIARLA